jgi:pimeloyl-ACP methyl ester carboxylesterase
MPTLDRNGVAIHYEVHGDMQQDDAPVVLLSHGYSATAQMWRGQLDALAHYRTITWDMRGHGHSDSPDDPALYSEAHTVADMAALLDHVGAGRAVIAGLSLGGYMSLAFHAALPARTQALMLFDTGPGYRNDAGRAGWNRTANDRAEALERDGLAALGQGAEVRQGTHRSALGLAHAARGMLAQVDARVIDSLPGIAVPTLVLVGENDTPFLTGSDYMARKIPGAVKVVLPGAGHAANIDQPEAFNRAMLSFLDSLPR